MHLLPIAIEFLDSYPDIALRLVLTDLVVNTVSESIDVAIRIGTVPDSSMMAIRIGSVVAFASPAYLAAHSHPKNPSDLSTMIVLQQMTWPLPACGSSRAAIEKLSRLSDRD
jgi:DNA-binding transcriptional LysR family regulator